MTPVNTYQTSNPTLDNELEDVVNAVKYMIDVWDEVCPSWRETPDHVQQKFLKAEVSIKAKEK